MKKFPVETNSPEQAYQRGWWHGAAYAMLVTFIYAFLKGALEALWTRLH